MKIKKIIQTIILIFFPFIFLELISSFIIFKIEKRNGFFFNLKVKKNEVNKYKVNFNKQNTRLLPGNYKYKNKNNITEYYINSQGFRGKDFNLKKKNQFRLITFGGSSTIGLESIYDKTYPALLEKKLKSQNIDVEVLNFALPSKSLNFARDLFFSEAIKYEPDFISIYSNRNSTMYDSFRSQQKIDNSIKNINVNNIRIFLHENIMTYRLLFKTFREIKSKKIKNEGFVSPYNDKIIHNIYYFTDQYKNTLDDIINFASTKKIKTILIKQGFYINPKIQEKLNEKSIDELIQILTNAQKLNIDNLSYKDSFWIITNLILNKQMEKFRNNKNVILIDPVPKLLKDKNHFTDYLHLTSDGNEILAEEIFLTKNKIFNN